MKFLVLISYLVGSSVLVEGAIKEYILYPGTSQWAYAVQYCRQIYSDLASFSSATEQQRIVEVFRQGYNHVWIGLYRKDQDSIWQWSDKQPVSFTQWNDGFPLPNSIGSSKNCAFLNTDGWTNAPCLYSYPFYCYRHLILVTESKTWVEALQYCTTNYKSLASLPYNTQVLQAKTEMVLTQTESVWTGLRFIDGKWFWVNGELVDNQASLLPFPSPADRCGALNNNTNAWENRDCKEKLNFLCYWT